MEELSQSATEGEIQDFGCQDILVKALGVPEKPGRVRGVGFGVSQRVYFPPEGRAKHKCETKRWETLVGQLSERLNNLEDKLKKRRIRRGRLISQPQASKIVVLELSPLEPKDIFPMSSTISSHPLPSVPAKNE